MTPPLLRIDRLELKEFRCFAECAIDLHPELTVLVAENGRGKTAVLDAVGIALASFVDTMGGSRQLHGFGQADVRLIQSASGGMERAKLTEFSIEGYIEGMPIHWHRARRGDTPRARTSTKNTADLVDAATGLRRKAMLPVEQPGNPAVLPLVAFYGTGRLWNEHRLAGGAKAFAAQASGRTSAYFDCLSSSSSFRGAVGWYERKTHEVRDPRFSVALSENLALLTAVNNAARIVLEPTGWSELHWDFEQSALAVRHPDHGSLPLSGLSDGVRSMIALVVDIARRCASLNSHLSEAAARLTPGVLLIDEVDMHLHPRWQQRVVGLLRETFPNLQMILSTHSPHVLSTVDRESIRVISIRDGRGLIEIPSLQTRGVESADVLSTIMRVDPVPQIEEAMWLSEYRVQIENGEADSDVGLAMRAKLSAHFGDEHPVMLDCARLLRFQAFKRKRPAGEEA